MIKWEMSQQLSRSSDRRPRNAKWARTCAIAILGFSVAYALMLPSGGISGMSFDSFRYLAGADSILASGTYLDISGTPQSTWPPGTSLLYAAVARLSGKPPEELTQFLNLGALLLIGASLWLIIEITIARWSIAIITFAAIFLNTAILSMLNKLWSDPLALAMSSAAIASCIVASRDGKNWFRWICIGSAFLSIALCLRYAMLPAVPILAAVAFWLSKTTASHRAAVLLPFLSPLLTLILFYFLGSAYLHVFSAHSVEMVRSFDFWQDQPAFVQMADQIFPVTLFSIWLSIGIVLGVIAVPAGAAFVTEVPEKRSALLICVGYVLLSCVFLVIAPAALHGATELRYLLQIYPFLLIGAAIAADVLLNSQRLDSRILGFIIVCLLTTVAVRSARAAALGILPHESSEATSCVSRTVLLNDLKRIPTTQNFSGALTNIQGLAWYAMRIPTVRLTQSALAEALSGTTIIFVRPEYTCSEVLESNDVSEIALSHATDISIVSGNGVLLIARKE